LQLPRLRFYVGTSSRQLATETDQSYSEEEAINLSLASKGPPLLLALNGEVSGAENIDELDLKRCPAEDP
jgi:hypothetical protein